MFKVPNEQDPYSAIGKYIRDHITAIEDIIAVIKINEVETNQLFMVDINEENYFIWENDWWEGEEDVTLIDFFPVSEAQRANQNAQSDDTISRQAAINAVEFGITYAKAIDVNTGESKELFKEGNDALKKAIERIKDLPFAQPNVPDTNVLDTISRQAAIEAIFNEPLCESGMKERTAIAVVLAIYEKINSLPSAQPEPCEDTISRQAAIEINRSYHGQMPNEVNHRIWKEINELPSAQSEHQKGEWIDYTEDGYVECPFCHSATNCDGNKDELHFCFSCGADMREPEDIPMEYFESGGR